MENNNFLLDAEQSEEKASLIDSLIDNTEQKTDNADVTSSLLSSDDNMTFAELNNDALSEYEIELRKKFFSDPKNQAQIILENYLKEQNVLVNRQKRRKIYEDIYRNAKKGKYNSMFRDYIYGVSAEESQENFSKLNG